MSTDVPSHFWSSLQRKLGIAWVTIILILVIVFAFPTWAEVPDLIIGVAIDDEGELQFYESGERIDNTRIMDISDEPVAVMFRDVEDPTSDWWQIDVIDIEGSAVTCWRSHDALTCLYDGTSTVEVILEATSQQTGRIRRKPLRITPPPQAQP